MREIIMKM